jgi:hypothetical protein
MHAIGVFEKMLLGCAEETYWHKNTLACSSCPTLYFQVVFGNEG